MIIEYEFYDPRESTDEIVAHNLDEINKLLRVLNPNEIRFVDVPYLREVCERSRLLVARRGASYRSGPIIPIVGMATLVPVVQLFGRFGHIEDVAVEEQSQGRGIGTALLNGLIAEAKRLRLQHLDLTSRPTREEANRLYLKVGFERRDTNCYRLKLAA